MNEALCLRSYGELGVQFVRVLDEVSELLSGQRSAGRQQVLPGRRLSGGYHGDVEGLHGAEGRHVQHQRDVRAPSGGKEDMMLEMIVFYFTVPALLKFKKIKFSKELINHQGAKFVSFSNR